MREVHKVVSLISGWSRASLTYLLLSWVPLLFGLLGATAKGDVIINEIMYHPYEPWPTTQPAKTTNDSEFVEIYNTGTATVDLAEYRFDSGINFTFPVGLTLAPGAYLAVCGNRTAFTNWYPSVTNYVGEYSGSLNNGGERVTLSHLVGGTWQTADTIKYIDFGKSDGEGPSLELIHSGFARLDDQYTGDWTDSLSTNGTPGRLNSSFSSSPLPVVGDVQHDPPLPPEGSSVRITARVIGRDGNSMAGVQVKYRQDAAVQVAWSYTPMNDNGVNGDLAAGDGIYSAMLPPYGQPSFSNGALVEFQVTATDAIGSRTFPITNTAGVLTGPYSYFCCFGEDTGFNGEYITYHILMTESNKSRLWAQTGGGATSDTYPLIDGTLISSDGKIFYNTAFRQRGSTRSNPFSYAVDLPAGQSHDGYRKVDFNFQNQFNNFLGMRISAAAGVPASRVKLMRLWMNGSLLQPTSQGQQMYLRVERPADVVSRLYPGDDGNLYKADGDGYRMGDLSHWNTLAEYKLTGSAGHGYDCATGNPYTAWIDLSNLTWALNLPATNLPAAITNYVKDIHEWAALYAVNTALNNSEPGILCPAGISGDELRIYGDRNMQFTWLTWDYSDVLGVGEYHTPTAWGYAGGVQGTVQNFLFNPPIAPFYAGHVVEILNDVMCASNMNAWIDEMGSAAYSLGTDWRTTYLNNVNTLRAALLPQINTNLTVQINGQTVTSDFLVVATTNVPVATLVTRSQSQPKGWKDLGDCVFNAVSGEYVKLTRVTANPNRITTADALMLSNATVQLVYDNSSSGFSSTGTWITSNTSNGYANTYYIQTTQQLASASWSVSVPSAGVYRVYAYAGMFNVSAADTNVEYRLTRQENRISASLSGTAPQNYTTRVLANGADCAWNTKSNAWSTVTDLTSREITFPVTVQAVDADGSVLKSRSVTLFGQKTPVAMSGIIASNTTWSGERGTIIVTGDVTVTSSATLSIASNTAVLFEPNARLVLTSGTLKLDGTADLPLQLFSRNASSSWSIEASGASVVTGQYATITGGRVTSTSGAQIDLTDCTLALSAGTNGIIYCNGAGATHLLRCIVTNYGTAIFQNTPTAIEECLFRQMSLCGIDLRDASSLATVRKSTVEQSASAAADGIHFSNCSVGLVSNCLIHALSGTGVVLTASSPSIVESLIHDAYVGVSASTSPSLQVRRTTIADTACGLKNLSSIPQDCILWGNIVAATGGPASAAYCDIELSGTNLYPGTGNLNRTPWFRDASDSDYRVQSISPCLIAGSSGGAIGAVFPVGATPAAPDGLWVTNVSASQAELHWTDNSSDEHWFEIQASSEGSTWASITNAPANATNILAAGLLPERSYVFRVCAAHERGRSLFTDKLTAETAADTTLQNLRDGLRITELMYNPPAPPAGSAFNNDDFEYIELQNTGAVTLNLSGLYFSNGITFAFTNGTILTPGSRMLLVKNAAAFASRYPGIPFQGVYAPSSLSNGGERIEIADANGNTVLDLTYHDGATTGWYPTTDGDGYSLVLANLTGNPDDPTSWRASTYLNGSPGAVDPDPPYGTIVINEVLSHQDQDNPGDWIELYNAGTGEVDVGYWFLSDKAAVLTNFQIAAGTKIPSGGFRVFTEFRDFGTNVLGSRGFALSEFGDSVYLSSADSSNRLTGYRTFVSFGAADNGVTFGRYRRSDGEVDFTALSAPTIGGSNAYPAVGPIVINEIMYNPFAGGKEYVEILNITDGAVPLFDIAYPTNTWRFNGAIEYVFPTNTWLAPGEHAVVASVDAAEFRQVYGLTSPSVRVFGPFTGALANSGETVKLYKPNPQELDGFVPYVIADRVQYADAAPWPVIADNGGPSLERIVPAAYGNDPINWVAATLGGTPGALNNTSQLSTVGFRVPDAVGFETNAIVPIELSLYPPCASTVTVQYAINGGTAVRNSDYAFTDGTLVFWPYETAKTVSLRIIDDSTPAGEPDETVVVGLTAVAGGAVMGGTRLFTYTIIDTDATNLPAPFISPAGTNYFTNSITVSMTNSLPGSVVRYTLDGTRPTASSPVFQGAFSLSVGTRVTARTFLGSYDSSASASALYIARTPAPQSPSLYFFAVLTNGVGTITGGNVWVTNGLNATAVAAPDSYSQFAGWTGDTGGAATGAPSLTVLMNTNRSVIANFVEKVATNATPQRWLAAYYGPTNDYDSAALSDTDGDGMLAWQEYHADTDPTNPLSVLAIIRAELYSNTTDLLWLSRTTRVYSVERTTNLMDGWLAPLTSGVPGHSSGTNEFIDLAPPVDKAFYRIEVQIP